MTLYLDFPLFQVQERKCGWMFLDSRTSHSKVIELEDHSVSSEILQG